MNLGPEALRPTLTPHMLRFAKQNVWGPPRSVAEVVCLFQHRSIVLQLLTFTEYT